LITSGREAARRAVNDIYRTGGDATGGYLDLRAGVLLDKLFFTAPYAMVIGESSAVGSVTVRPEATGDVAGNARLGRR